METKCADKRSSRRNAGAVDSKMVLVIVAIFFMAAILVVLMALVVTLRNSQRLAEYQPSATVKDRIGYATEGVTVIDDEGALQRAVDEMMNAEDKSVGLLYRNDAYSDDGENFTCYMGNSDVNALPAFFTIATDGGMSDVVYTSGLLNPGQVLEKIKLDHPLEEGNHTVFVAITLLDEKDGEQIIDRQLIYNMDFHVA